MRAGLMIVLATLAVPAIAQEQPAAPPPAKKVCRITEPDTGTLIGAHRTCHTVAEWREIENRANKGRHGSPVPPNVALDALVVQQR